MPLPAPPIDLSACTSFADAKRAIRRNQSRARMARLRERRGAAVSTSISLPPAVHEAAARLHAISRRGRDSTSAARAYLTGVMMAACAGQSAVRREMAAEFDGIRAYLASLDGDHTE